MAGRAERVELFFGGEGVGLVVAAHHTLDLFQLAVCPLERIAGGLAIEANEVVGLASH